MPQNYNTKSRQLILKFLESNCETTVSVLDIINHLSDSGITVNPTTVYRYLNKLTLEKKVIKISGEDGQKSLFQLKQSGKVCDEHIHTQCINCGKLIHLDCDFMEELKKHLKKDHGFHLKCKGSILYGICDECSKQ